MSNKGIGALIKSTVTGRYLVVRRSQTTDFPGTWCCLGGGVDVNETLKQALFRELKEEANINKESITSLKPVVLVKSENYVYTNCIAHCKEELIVTLNHEHDGMLWVTKEQLLQLNLHPKFKQALDLLLKENK